MKRKLESAPPRGKFVLRPYRRIPTWYHSYYFSGNLIGKGIVMNVSRTGLRVLGEHSVKPGTELSIRLSLDEDGAPLEISRASVCWADHYEFGVKIDRLTPGAAHRIAGLINDHIAARPVPSHPL